MINRLRATILILLCVLCCAPAALAEDLALWQGPARQALLDYIQAVTTPGGPDFIPTDQRKAAFDLDGTLIVERPAFLALELTVERLEQACPKGGGQAPQGLAQLCQAYQAKGRKALMGPQIEAALTKPFDGMGFDEYEALSRRLMDSGVNPQNGLPNRLLVYPPMIELIDLLHDKGFAVYICSGAPNFFVRAISRQHLHVDPDRCIGTLYQAHPRLNDGKLGFVRGDVSGSPNLDMQKAVNLLQRLGGPPVLAFGNSGGDEQMLQYALSGRWRGLALLLDHDDEREFRYGDKELPQRLARQGVVVVSMRQSFRQVFKQP